MTNRHGVIHRARTRTVFVRAARLVKAVLRVASESRGCSVPPFSRSLTPSLSLFIGLWIRKATRETLLAHACNKAVFRANIRHSPRIELIRRTARTEMAFYFEETSARHPCIIQSASFDRKCLHRGNRVIGRSICDHEHVYALLCKIIGDPVDAPNNRWSPDNQSLSISENSPGDSESSYPEIHRMHRCIIPAALNKTQDVCTIAIKLAASFLFFPNATDYISAFSTERLKSTFESRLTFSTFLTFQSRYSQRVHACLTTRFLHRDTREYIPTFPV